MNKRLLATDTKKPEDGTHGTLTTLADMEANMRTFPLVSVSIMILAASRAQK